MFRSYRLNDGQDSDEVNFELADVYAYDGAAKTAEDERIPGSPKDDYADSLAAVGAGDAEYALYGFPAPKDIPMYVYSKGLNQLPDANGVIQVNFSFQDYAFYGGGDDISNWDKAT